MPGSKRRLDDGPPVGRRSPGDEAGGHVDVGLIARADRSSRARCPTGGTGSTNDARPGANVSGAPHSSVSANGPGPGQQRRCACAVGDERQRPAGSAAVDQRGARDQADAADARSAARRRPGEHAARRVAIDADAQVGAGQHGADRRERRSLRRPAREIDQPVVFGERERHGSRASVSRLGRPHAAAARRRHGRSATNDDRQTYAILEVRSWFSLLRIRACTRLTSRSTLARSASAVSSDARNTDGPNDGNVTCTGSEPTTVRPPASFLKRSTSACSPLRRRRRARASTRRDADATCGGPRRAKRGCERARIVCPRETRPAAARRESAASSAARRPVRDTGRSSAGSSMLRVPLVRSTRRIRCRYISSTTKVGASSPARPFSSGSSTASRFGHAGTNRTAADLARSTRSTPAGSVDLQKAALVVADGVARLDEQPAVFRGERAIARLFDVGDEHRLRRVADDVTVSDRGSLPASGRGGTQSSTATRGPATISPSSDGSAGSSPRAGRSPISPAPTTSTATPPVSRSADGMRTSGTAIDAVARRPRVALRRRTMTSVATGSSSRTRSSPPLGSQSATVGAVHLVDDEPGGNARATHLAREPLQHFDAHGAGDLPRVFAEADDLASRARARAAAARRGGRRPCASTTASVADWAGRTRSSGFRSPPPRARRRSRRRPTRSTPLFGSARLAREIGRRRGGQRNRLGCPRTRRAARRCRA